MNGTVYSVIRALAIAVNAVAFWTEANFFARNWSHWHENQSYGYGLLLASTVLALVALGWPERYRQTWPVTGERSD
jgi:hypothetical protein